MISLLNDHVNFFSTTGGDPESTQLSSEHDKIISIIGEDNPTISGEATGLETMDDTDFTVFPLSPSPIYNDLPFTQEPSTSDVADHPLSSTLPSCPRRLVETPAPKKPKLKSNTANNEQFSFSSKS